VLQIASEPTRKHKEIILDKRFTGALSIKGAMEYLGDIGKTKIYDLIKRGEIKVARIDSKPVVLISELDDFLARISEAADDRLKTS
jgi:hypothetical protein